MDSFFRIVTSNQWEEAQITGIIPGCSNNVEDGYINVYQFSDLENVCNSTFRSDDYPLALEFSSGSYLKQLTWSKSSTEKSKEVSWRVGRLVVDLLTTDFVLSIYSFEYIIANGCEEFQLQGEV